MPDQKKPKKQNAKWDPTFAERAYQAIARYHMTHKQLAKMFGVGPTTICEWKQSHPTFAEAIQKGTDHFNMTRLEPALIRRALGYKTLQVRRRYGPDGQLKWEQMDEVEVPPDTNALKFFLSCRDGKRWPNQPNIIGGGGGFRLTILSSDGTPAQALPHPVIIESRVVEASGEATEAQPALPAAIEVHTDVRSGQDDNGPAVSA